MSLAVCGDLAHPRTRPTSRLSSPYNELEAANQKL